MQSRIEVVENALTTRTWPFNEERHQTWLSQGFDIALVSIIATNAQGRGEIDGLRAKALDGFREFVFDNPKMAQRTPWLFLKRSWDLPRESRRRSINEDAHQMRSNGSPETRVLEFSSGGMTTVFHGTRIDDRNLYTTAPTMSNGDFLLLTSRIIDQLDELNEIYASAYERNEDTGANEVDWQSLCMRSCLVGDIAVCLDIAADGRTVNLDFAMRQQDLAEFPIEY